QKYGLEQARALRNAAEAQLKHEENDISEFVQSIKAALELQVGYIDALYQYNESIIEYQLYQK
ncbi:MAG: TolC family protein, partial [Tannerellaceae bacterium]